MGFWSKSWQEIQERYPVQPNKRRKIEGWIKSDQLAVWSFARDQWVNQKKVAHGDTPAAALKIEEQAGCTREG